MPRVVTKFPKNATQGVRLIREKVSEDPHYIAGLAKKLKLTRHAIYMWKVVPVHRLVEVEKHSGIRRELLRPDLFA